MSLAFATILSGIPFARTPRSLCRTPDLPHPLRHKHPLQPRAKLIHSAEKEDQVTNIETQLRALDAPSAADQAYVALSTPNTPVPSTWMDTLLLLKDYGITGELLSRMASRLGILSLLNVSPARAGSLFKLLDTAISLSASQKRRVLTSRPDLLLSDVNLVNSSLESLQEAGLRRRDLQRLVVIWPRMLLLHPAYVNRVTRFLQHSPLWIPKHMLRPLLRRAPWILVFDIDSQMAPVAYWLDEYVFPFLKRPDRTRFILSAPMVLSRSRSSLNEVMEFLWSNTRLTDTQQVSVLRQFPSILTFSVDEVLQPAVDYFVKDLHFSTSEVSRLIHAFPRIITLRVEQDILPVVKFLVSRRISNVSRIIKRFPPILANDLMTDTIPKMNYLEHELGLTVHDILKFPGYFSYDLEARIIPRTKFAQENGVSISKVGLSRMLSSSDETFCKLVHMTQESYKLFCESVASSRKLINGLNISEQSAGKEALEATRPGPP
ncbi:Transcription termination factor MTERF5, chloroplastic [Gracilariopsis chorda]|uniref:Transcription termination factor MTERF5, chloroplastic n=1 Tax=Gracilariopsis chorda TaxID=448386 RepID=A0A2V3IPV6_9FLOR|nr:Transcription termination factor MTERF5, chloroplastic [Gracilariopsis chorda]|eukprot:PXF44089.1 Transcription termination factor MTERF5, chloroplastic [Gracilariopsis chorda]